MVSSAVLAAYAAAKARRNHLFLFLFADPVYVQSDSPFVSMTSLYQ